MLILASCVLFIIIVLEIVYFAYNRKNKLKNLRRMKELKEKYTEIIDKNPVVQANNELQKTNSLLQINLLTNSLIVLGKKDKLAKDEIYDFMKKIIEKDLPNLLNGESLDKETMKKLKGFLQ